MADIDRVKGRRSLRRLVKMSRSLAARPFGSAAPQSDGGTPSAGVSSQSPSTSTRSIILQASFHLSSWSLSSSSLRSIAKPSGVKESNLRSLP
jgi:hypothetical protein